MARIIWRDQTKLRSCDACGCLTFLDPCRYCDLTFCDECQRRGYRYLYDCMCGRRGSTERINFVDSVVILVAPTWRASQIKMKADTKLGDHKRGEQVWGDKRGIIQDCSQDIATDAPSYMIDLNCHHLLKLLASH